MKFIKSKHAGARNELASVVWLLDQGYDVFRNVSSYGSADLVAIKDTECLLIDVKQTECSLTAEQLKLGVRLLVPDPVNSWRFVDRDNLTPSQRAVKRARLRKEEELRQAEEDIREAERVFARRHEAALRLANTKKDMP